MSEMSRDIVSDNSTVIDSPKVLVYLAAAAGSFGLACWNLYWPVFTEGTGLTILISCGLLVVCVLAILIFRVNAKGHVIDVENDRLEFSGGGIEADSWTSYFDPSFLLQIFSRHEVPLSEIRHINAYRDRKSWVDDKGKSHTKTRHIVEINGDFGAVSFPFWSKGKRDQLYSAIVQINEMGDPILKR